MTSSKKKEKFFFNRLLILIFPFLSFTVHFMQIDTQYWTTIAKSLQFSLFFGNDDGVVLVEGLQVVFMLKEKTFFFPLNRTKERGASEGEQKKYYWCHNSQDDDHHRKIFFIYIWSKDFWDINSISNPHHGKCHSAFALIQKKNASDLIMYISKAILFTDDDTIKKTHLHF